MNPQTANLETPGAEHANAPSSIVREAPLRFWPSVCADALAHVPPESRPALRGGPAWLVFRILLKSPGVRCTVVYRVSHTLRATIPIIGVIASKFLFWFMRHWYGCAISGTARVGGGLVLPHPMGIVIGADVRIGERAWIFQNVTVGGAPHKKGMPAIGSDARLYAGAVIVGPIHIGDDVVVGANAVVAADVPDHSQVRAPRSDVSPRSSG